MQPMANKQFESDFKPLFGFWGNGAPAWRVRSVGFDSSNMAQKRSFCTACIDIGEEEPAKYAIWKVWGRRSPNKNPPNT